MQTKEASLSPPHFGVPKAVGYCASCGLPAPRTPRRQELQRQLFQSCGVGTPEAWLELRQCQTGPMMVFIGTTLQGGVWRMVCNGTA